jgi:integrase
MTHARALDDFLADCRARGWADGSLAAYAATLCRLTGSLPDSQDVAATTVDDIRRYRATRQRTVARNTLAGEEAHLASYFGWLYRNGHIPNDPVGQLDRTRRVPSDDLDVTTVDTADVRLLLEAARPGPEQTALAILAYLGPRRHAVSALRLDDYDQARGVIRFREKGAKTIVKPVPAELAAILDASISRGDILEPPDDYLVPPRGLLRLDDRDDRAIWRIVKDVAERAGVTCHVHALRAAFACFYLDQHPDDLLGLKDLLGHRSVNTTLIYLRRRDRQAGMERVRTLSWAPVSPLKEKESSVA